MLKNKVKYAIVSIVNRFDRNDLFQILILALGFAISIYISFTYPIFRLGQTWEEDLLFDQVGKNVHLRGFWSDLFLDNYALGVNPDSHPFYYTHFPTLFGLTHWALSFLFDLPSIKKISILFFAFGQIYYLLVIRKLFPPIIVNITITLSILCYPGSIAWSDSSVHSFHWILIYGAIFHFLNTISNNQGNGRRWSLTLFLFYSFLSLYLSLIHGLTIMMFVVWYSLINKVNKKYILYLTVAFSCALGVHFLRLLHLLPLKDIAFDLSSNLLKASNGIGYEALVTNYRDLGIVLWPSDFSLNRYEVYKLIFNRIIGLIGVLGLILIIISLVIGLLNIFRGDRRFKYYVNLVLFPFGAFIWAIIFPVHFANYFYATPLIIIFQIYFLSIALFIYTLDSYYPFKGMYTIWTLPLVIYFSVNLAGNFPYPLLKDDDIKVPAYEVLAKYKGEKFYTNIWPFLISYYTHNWVIGGISPLDAASLNYQAATYIFQKDYKDSVEYSSPDYYLWISNGKFARYANFSKKEFSKFSNLVEVESGRDWIIFKFVR